jgi:hypothetical protein
MFASSLEVIAPLRVETASGKKVIFRRRAKPVPKPIPVSSLRRLINMYTKDTDVQAGWEGRWDNGRIEPTLGTYP